MLGSITGLRPVYSPRQAWVKLTIRREAVGRRQTLRISNFAAAPLRQPRSRQLFHCKSVQAASNGTSTQALEELYDGPPLRGPLDNSYIIALILQERRHLVLAGLALVACVAGNLASPIISGMLFETLVMRQPFSAYKQLLVWMVAVYVLEPILTAVYIRQACSVGEKVQASLRREAYRVLLMQRIEFFDKHGASEITTVLSKDLEAVRTFVFNNVSRDRGLRAFMEASGSVIALFWLSWRMGPILAGVIVATAGIAWLYKAQSRKLEAASAQAQSRMAMAIDQTVTQIRAVRIFAGESLERERFGVHVQSAYAAGMGFAKAKALLESLNRGAIHLSLLALYALGGYLVNQGLMPIRILLSAISFTFSLVFATQGLLQTWTDARQAAAAIGRSQRVLSELSPDPWMAQALPPGAWWELANEMAGSCALSSDEEIEVALANASGRSAVEAACSGNLEFAGVSFSYPTRPGVKVINDLNLVLPRGKITALVGRSGAGKSTVASLIERLYSPDEGAILLDGTPIDTFTRAKWMDAVTAVAQEPVLFSGTIYDNIAYAKPQATREDVENAAKAANAHDFIQTLPNGYGCTVGERGGLLSGGQRQRIALARALLKDAPIIILDEATSALDSESERLVQKAIDTLVEGRTVLVIAHRLSTVQAADQIVVMEEGHVVEQGTHAELVKLNGRYKSLVSSQSLTLSASV